MINYPTTLDTFTNPLGTDVLTSPDHAQQHADANDAIEALQAKVGVDGSAVTSSHDYKLSGVTGSDKAVSITGTETLTNKTLTSPNINEAVALTATATELNILDGATLTTTELNYVDGVTSAIQTQLNGKQATITFGTGVETALGVNVGSAGAFVTFNGALGTPSSGTLTNATGLPVAGITSSTSTALGVGSLELGHANDTTLSRSSAGVLAVEGVVIPSISSTNTLTNKRITPRVSSETSSATPTINTDNSDAHSITALATAITSMTTNLSGTPTNFQKLIIRIKDNGTARAITWGASFEDAGVALPTTTVISKLLTVGFLWNSVSSKWGCVAVSNET